MDGNREREVFLNKDCTVCDHTLIGWIYHPLPMLPWEPGLVFRLSSLKISSSLVIFPTVYSLNSFLSCNVSHFLATGDMQQKLK